MWDDVGCWMFVSAVDAQLFLVLRSVWFFLTVFLEVRPLFSSDADKRRSSVHYRAPSRALTHNAIVCILNCYIQAALNNDGNN